DMWMSQGGEDRGLQLETCQTIRIAGKRSGKYLDCDIASEPRVAGAIDLAHTAGSDKGANLVHSQASSGRQLHSGRRNAGFQDRLLQKTARAFVSGQQCYDFFAQCFIARAGFSQIFLPQARIAFQPIAEHTSCLLPSFRSHKAPPIIRSHLHFWKYSFAENKPDAQHRTAGIDEDVGTAEILAEEIVFNNTLFSRVVEDVQNISQQFDSTG